MSVEPDQLFQTTGRIGPEHPDDLPSSAGDATWREIVDEIERAETADRIEDYWRPPETRKLPGFGQRRETCGDPFAQFCADCGYVSEWGQTCHESTCPRCSASWAMRTGTSLASQLEQIRRVRQAARDRHQRFHHVVFSPPADWHPASDDQWARGADVCRDVLEAADLEGVVIYHPFRGDEEGSDDDKGDLGKWKDRIFSDRDWDDLRDDLRFSPHYHAIVVGHEIPGGATTRRVESETGWIIHRITKEDSKVSLYDEFDLARAVTYCLSHAGLYETPETTRYCHKKVGSMKPGLKPYWQPDENLEDERLRREMDAVVRSVAPVTLGLDYNDLACGADECDHDHSDDEKVDLDFAQGRRRAERFAATSGSSSTDDRDDWRLALPDGIDGDDLDPDDLRSMSDDDLPAGLDRDDVEQLLVDEDDDPTRQCNGRLVSIAKAERYLDDDDWRRSAPHADDLEAEFEYWSSELDWVG